MDEDFVGRIARIAKACAGGASTGTLGSVVLAKYRRGLPYTKDLVATARL